jgi:enamine deaminase RidA (YjgF/YER057c/UK114 family)
MLYYDRCHVSNSILYCSLQGIISKPNFMHEVILPDGWAKPIGYSDGVLAQEGRMLFIAGQVGWDNQHVFRSDELVPQFEQALKNVLAVLEKAGGKTTDICRMNCFCTNKEKYLASRKEIGKIWRTLMGNHYPAMSMIFVVDLLDSPGMIEIETTAVISGK